MYAKRSSTKLEEKNVRKNRAETADSRRQILIHAARLFRERGVDGVSVADIMAAAGMTHGGFYKHFASKEALFVAAVAASFDEKLDFLGDLFDVDAQDGLHKYLDSYLSREHVEDRSSGCPIAGLTTDALRSTPEAKDALSDGAQATLTRFSEATGSEAEAIRVLTTAIGSIILARAVQDDTLRERILDLAADQTGTGVPNH